MIPYHQFQGSTSEWLGFKRSREVWDEFMDIIRQLRNQGLADEKAAYDSSPAMGQLARPQTITELIDSQIKYHEMKIADLKAAKEAVSPEVEKALNALAKL